MVGLRVTNKVYSRHGFFSFAAYTGKKENTCLPLCGKNVKNSRAVVKRKF